MDDTTTPIIPDGDFGAFIQGSEPAAPGPAVTSGITSGAEVAAAQQQRILSENRTVTMRNRRMGTAILPGGIRRPAAPYMHVRYTMRREADILGNPEQMLTEDWKSEHRGWRYQWPIRQSNQTASHIRAGWMVPVPYEAIRDDDPMAAIADIKTPGGRYIVWKQHILVAVSPQYHDLMVTQYEDYAVARTVNNPESISTALERANPGYVAEVNPYENPRASKTGD